MKKETWLVVANSSLARIFKLVKRNALEEIEVFEHPESRLHNLDLVTDKPGRELNSLGVGRHALESKEMPKEHEFALFAKQLAVYLEEACRKGDVSGLYIAASPTLLGLLRHALHTSTSKLIKGEVDKDMTHLKAQELLSHLPFFF